MSPLNVRRYRAERLLRGEFEALRERVTAIVRARLRGSGVKLDASDLEAAYAQAWQGLYLAVLEGQEVANPVGWLALVTFRRALDEHRARGRVDDGEQRCGEERRATAVGCELAAQLDDRARLRQLFEGLRGRLSAREREAAVLCYLQGLSRAQAAQRMGVSETRMRKLMEGDGAEAPGVAGKVGTLVDAIREGSWCEEQGSLMRALAYGILDPDGERYQLARLHRDDCPSCRAYVTSLRGLAATLPPVFLPPWGLAATGGANTGAACASTAAGAGAGASGMAGGGWLFAGGAKLAVGCVFALSVGAGCVAIGVGGGRAHEPAHGRRAAHALAVAGSRSAMTSRLDGQVVDRSASMAATAPATVTPGGRVSREFGPEQALALAARRSVIADTGRTLSARVASSGAGAGGSSGEAGSDSANPPTASAAGAAASSTAGGTSDAEREFAPG